MSSMKRWIGVVAVAAILLPAGLNAQSPARPADESRAIHTAARIKAEIDTPRATALRQSIAREVDRQAQGAKKPGAPAPNWLSRHKKGIIGALVVAGLVMLVIGIANANGE